MTTPEIPKCHIARMELEKDALMSKINNLRAFINHNPRFLEQESIQQILMGDQLCAMLKYADILTQRINAAKL